MILVDSTIWCAHLPKARTKNRRFAELIAEREVVCHPWVFGELLLAGISDRVALEMRHLDFLPVAAQDDVLGFIRKYRPQSVGWVDVNLLVACLNSDARLWTLDKGLRANAERHGRAFRP